MKLLRFSDTESDAHAQPAYNDASATNPVITLKAKKKPTAMSSTHEAASAYCRTGSSFVRATPGAAGCAAGSAQPPAPGHHQQQLEEAVHGQLCVAQPIRDS